MAETIDYKGLLQKYFPEKKLDEASLLKADEQSFLLVKELLEKVKPIVATREAIHKEQGELAVMLGEVLIRLDKLIDMKNANSQKESEVLDLLKQELIGP